MKITNIFENIEYLTTYKEIRDYLDSIEHYHGFTLDNDYILYKGNMIFDRIDEYVPLKIKECQNFAYLSCVLNAKNVLPIECDELKIDMCSIANQNFMINSIAKHYAILSSHFQNKLTIHNSNDTYCEIDIVDSTLSEFAFISSSRYTHFNVKACKNITSFANIILPHIVSNYTIESVGIKNFKDFETTTNQVLSINSASFQNYLLIDSIKAGYMYIYIHNNVNNLLTILLNTHASQLYVKRLENTSYPNIDELIKIFAKYTKNTKNIRADYIMDCAVELIDAGFDEAAEI